MTSKIIAFVLGIAIGAGLCAAVLSRSERSDAVAKSVATSTNLFNQIAGLETQLGSTKARLEAAEQMNDALNVRVQSLMKEAAASTKEPPADQPAKRTGLAALFGGDGTNGMSKAMTEMVKTMAEQQVESTLSGMKTRLNLSPQQEQAIREIMTRQTRMGTDIAQKMLSGDLSEEELMRLSQDQPNQEVQIKALLTPEQLAAYDDYQKEEQTRMARLSANAELLQLQSQLHLTEEQQDQVFAVLADQALAQYDGSQKAPADALNLRGQYDKRAEALKGVLTPEQFNRYQKFQEQQLKLIEALIPQGLSNVTIRTPAVIAQ